MAKQSGLGDNLYVAGYDISGDVGALGAISGPTNMLDGTAINQSGNARIPGQRDGNIEYTAYFDPALGASHEKLSTLPTSDQLVSYERGTNLGDPAACMVGKQIDYDPSRGQDGSLTFKVQAQANGFGLEWGRQATAGKRTDVAATLGVALDYAAVQAGAYGLQAYLHVFAFTGTDATVKLQDSADNITFADIVGAAFTQVTANTPAGQRLAVTAVTVRRYVRAVTVTTGGFTSLTFAVTVVRNEIAPAVF